MIEYKSKEYVYMKLYPNVNNIKPTFKAYYREDASGQLKKLYNNTKNLNKLEESLQQLKQNRPNHALEIVEAKFIRGTEESPKTDWREATRSMWQYTIFNNENGRSIKVNTPAKDEHLEQITKTLANFSDDLFWNSKKEEENLYNELLTPNKKLINTNNKIQKTKTFVNKVKDFMIFWFKF